MKVYYLSAYLDHKKSELNTTHMVKFISYLAYSNT
jgi:hypothetical protein